MSLTKLHKYIVIAQTYDDRDYTAQEGGEPSRFMVYDDNDATQAEVNEHCLTWLQANSAILTEYLWGV